MNKLLLGALLVLAPRIIAAQGLDHNLLNAPTPKSPEAAAILKFVDSPVSYFNGSADITIPIYTLAGQDISLPISISFSTTGLKVDDVPSWVGHGWNLNATSVIGRTIYDIPDDYANGYLNSSEYFRDDGRPITDSCSNVPPGATEMELYNFYIDTYLWYESTNRSVGLNVPGDNYKDTEPDVFTYSTPTGLSGKFVLNLDGEIKMIPKKNAKIHMISNGSEDKEFQIFDQNGIQYYFGSAVERVNSNTNCGTTGGSRYSISPISSWHIGMMRSERTGEEITFGYIPTYTSFTGSQSATKSFVIDKYLMDDRAASLDVTCTSTTSVEGQQIQTISFRGTTIYFTADTTQRLDLTGGHRLKEITVVAQGDTIKQFKFYHSYANSNAYLQLDSVVEFGNHHVRLPAYKFQYEPVNHYRNDFGQDHWGYYNGAGNTTLLPNYQQPIFQINHYGANRESNEMAMKEGSLKKITYPTGGYTDFEYECNTVPELQEHIFGVSVEANSSSALVSGDRVDYEEFTLAEATWVEIVGVDFWEGPGGELSAECGVMLTGVGNPYSQFIEPNADRRFYLLPAGTYRLTAYMDQYNSPVPNVTCILQWKTLGPELINRPVGGLRIKSIKKYDGRNEQPVLSKRLLYTGADGLSTGKLYTGEHYWYDQEFNDAAPCGEMNMGCCGLDTGLKHRILKSNNLISPTEVMGTPIGYTKVTEYVDSTASGKSIYTFRNATNFFTLYDFPQVQNTTLNYKLNLLTNKSDYDASGTKIKESKTFYRFGEFTNQVDTVYGFQAIIKRQSACPQVCDYLFSTYMHFSEPMETDSTADIQYINGQALITGTKFIYDTIRAQGTGKDQDYYYVLREMRTTDSQGKRWTVNTKYPFDFKSETEMNKLYTANNYTPVMQILRDNSNNVYDAQIRSFNDHKLVKQFRFESTSTPAFSTINAITSTTAPGSPFVEKAEYVYADDDLVAIKRKDQPVETVVWDANSRDYPIAIVMNATPDKVFHTSFEYESTNVNTSSAKTGLKARTTAYTVTLPSAGTYILTYWKKVSTGNWQLITATVNSNTSIGGGSNVLIDEVRLIPADATITTYTHRKGIGITSITDPNNVSQYFIYDEMKRLKLVRDDKGNILKKNVYHYKGNAAHE